MTSRAPFRPQPIAGLLGILMGLFATAVGIDMIRDGSESSQWPTVPGTITRTAIEHHVTTGGTMAQTEESYYANLAYAYEFDGTSYEGTRYHIGGSRKFDAEANAALFLEHYPVGTRVTVFVNPKLPDWAVLSTGVPAAAQLITGMGALFLVVGGALLVHWRRAHSLRRAE